MGVKMDKTQRLRRVNTNKAINSWFSEHYLDNPERLRQNKTWQALRKGMTIMGHYKAKDRGKHDARYLTHATGGQING